MTESKVGERGPRIALRPADGRDWVASAVHEGGGELVDVDQADALIWAGGTDGHPPSELASLLAGSPQIRWVQLPSAGIESYVTAGLLDAGRIWTSAKGVYARPVAEHALALALAGMRQFKRYALARSWSGPGGRSLSGAAVTIFGGGGIGEELIGLLRQFACRVTLVRRQATPLSGAERVISFAKRQDALPGADVVFLASALTGETSGGIARAELEVMEPHAWLVNVARGGLVVTDDLVWALSNQVIGGAALDVTDPEPLPDRHPLWDLPNCLITPHTANPPWISEPLLARRIAENVRRFGAGEPLLGAVDPREPF